MEEKWIKSAFEGWELRIDSNTYHTLRRADDHSVRVSGDFIGWMRFIREDGREFRTFEEAAAAPKLKFKVGDLVYILGPHARRKGQIGKVTQVCNTAKCEVETSDHRREWYGFAELQIAPEPPAKNHYHVFHGCDGMTKRSSAQKAHEFGSYVPFDHETTAGQALRHNSGKPESDYVFCYLGGVQAAFGIDHKFINTLTVLGEVYRSASQADLEQNAFDLIQTLGADCFDAGISIVEALADTNSRGAKKYPQGNFLKGANWRQYFQGAARHAEKSGEKDSEGFTHDYNFIFNVLMLHHCIALEIGTDDRIKKP